MKAGSSIDILDFQLRIKVFFLKADYFKLIGTYNNSIP